MLGLPSLVAKRFFMLPQFFADDAHRVESERRHEGLSHVTISEYRNT